MYLNGDGKNKLSGSAIAKEALKEKRAQISLNNSFEDIFSPTNTTKLDNTIHI